MAQQEIHRNPNGTFGKGTVANPAGRPKREIEESTLASIVEYETPERIRQIIEAMHLQATKFGNVQAARLILDYIAGKPVEQLNLTHEETPDVVLKLPTFQAGDNGHERGED